MIAVHLNRSTTGWRQLPITKNKGESINMENVTLIVLEEGNETTMEAPSACCAVALLDVV